jgi:hypothetical protein
MRLFLVAASFVAMALGISAQEVPPHAAPPATTESRGIGKLDNQKKTDAAKQDDSKSPPVMSCGQCINCCTVEQPHTKGKEEQAKADSLDALYRRYMWATIAGVIGAWIGLCVLVWQTVASRTSAQRQLRAYVGISTMTGEIKNANTLEIVVGFKNFGLTPAYNVYQFVDYWIGEYPLKTTLKEPLSIQEGSQGTLFPGPEYWSGTTVDMTKKPPVGKDNALFIYGKITYRDAFGKERYTKYRYCFHPTDKVPSLTIGQKMLLNVDTAGNEAN